MLIEGNLYDTAEIGLSFFHLLLKSFVGYNNVKMESTSFKPQQFHSNAVMRNAENVQSYSAPLLSCVLGRSKKDHLFSF